MTYAIEKNINMARTIGIFIFVVTLSFVFMLFIDIHKAEAKTVVAIWNHYPCRNIVYSDGSHCPWSRCGGGGSTGVTTPPPPPPPPDQCHNIRGYQYPVPRGFNKNGGQCILKSEFYLSCRAIPNPVKPGDDFNFIAVPLYHSGDVDFTWYQGSSAGGGVLKTHKTDGVSVLSTDYSSEGNKQVTVVGVDDKGIRQERTCGVSVRADADSVAQIDHGEANATVDFELEEYLTNNTCTAKWSAANVAQCFIVNTQGITEAVTSLSGQKEVGAGTWFLRCISEDLVGGAAYVIQSDEHLCRTNLDIREQ